ncbi:unnamed protein product [Caenorhabditis angaria]|uniref:G-protein coupled receptors family 1 profile domain-containing protein n=1 Tax=Caenorhabditis angaria TaxID=860376 RepID=A0A9P1IUV1_9PELO|nr:unnamed protein product [Caenorhabditis angaria]
MDIAAVFLGVSTIINIVFIYLLHSEKPSHLGEYRFVLTFFAVFNIVFSLSDFLISTTVFNYKQSGIVVLVGGIFANSDMAWKEWMILFRCSFYGLGYALLLIHFIYRYYALFGNQSVLSFSQLSFIAFLFFLIHGSFWMVICRLLLFPNIEMLQYIRPGFIETFGFDPSQAAIIGTVLDLNSASSSLYWKGLVGTIILSFVSLYSILSYIILGYKILSKLREHRVISNRLKRQHHLLFRSLVIQTLIPCFTSFFPCILGWYSPILQLEMPPKNG